MESRLPKPKFTLKKTNNTMDINTNNNKQQAAKCEKNATRSASSKNENKPLAKPVLVRSKTLTTFTRETINPRPIKRTATTVNTVTEAKKPFVKPKALVNRPNAPNNNTMSKGIQNDTGKIQKWDLRGRLAQTSDKLSVANQKNKDMETKYNELRELVDSLKSSETAYKNKAGQLEASHNTLSAEFKNLMTEMSTISQEKENLSKRLKESEELYASTSHMLKELQEKHNAQTILLSKQNGQLTTLKTVVETQEKINEDMNIKINELQALTHKMDKERRLLHNAIQELKGNIRVFCRVRPRTPKEVELMKTYLDLYLMFFSLIFFSCIVRMNYFLERLIYKLG